MDWDRYGYVVASDYRSSIVRSLSEKPKTPSELQKETDYHLSHISTTLSDLRDHGLVECLTEERNKGRVYALTDTGSEVAEQLML